MPRFFNLPSGCRTSFIPVFSQRTILLTHSSEQTCALKTFSEIDGQQAFSRRKEYFDPFSVAQVIIVRSFNFFLHFSFNSFVFSFCTQIFTFSLAVRRTTTAGSDFKTKTTVSLPVNNCWSWIWLKRAKQTLMCSFLYFLIIRWN